MKTEELEGVLSFLKGAEQLKNTLRSARTSEGRQESTAEHTWRLCLMVMVFADQYPDISALKLMKMCIIHDLGEAVSGDIPAVEQVEGVDKNVAERADLLLLLDPLPKKLQSEILALWDEYEAASTPEAKLAKAFDKIETLLQHTQGQNPADFDYEFNLSYGKAYTDQDGLTAALRAMVDEQTRLLADES